MSQRCLVVGAGAIGAATAFRLAEAGARVTVVDAHGPGTGTSSTSFAWVGASPYGLWDYFELNVAGMAAYRRLRSELGRTPWYVSHGTFAWFTDPARRGELEDRVAELRETGYPASLIPSEQAGRLEPDLALADTVEAVASYPDEGYVFVRPMIAELLARAAARGARCRYGARVVGLEARDDGVTATLSGGDRIEADTVVLCCGRWSGEAARLVGGSLPMIAPATGSLAVGLLVLTTPGVHRIRRVLIADELMIRPDGGGRLLLHSDEHDRLVDPLEPRGRLEERAAAIVEAAAQHLSRTVDPAVQAAVVGIRALTLDLLPAVGRLPGAERVYLAATHSGITLAPVLGELIASELTSGLDEPLLRRFRPGRFADGGTHPDD